MGKLHIPQKAELNSGIQGRVTSSHQHHPPSTGRMLPARNEECEQSWRAHPWEKKEKQKAFPSTPLDPVFFELSVFKLRFVAIPFVCVHKVRET